MTFYQYLKVACLVVFAAPLTMCKSDAKGSEKTTTSTASTMQMKIDSSLVNFDRKRDFHHITYPAFNGWNRVLKSHLQLNVNPNGYTMRDTLNYILPSSKTFMSITYAQADSSMNTDYKMFYDRVRNMSRFKEYHYNKHPSGDDMIHEIKLKRDSFHIYKLIYPKGNDIVQVDLLTEASVYESGLRAFVEQLPQVIGFKKD